MKATATKPAASPLRELAVKSVVEQDADSGCEYQQLGSDIFHDLSQPLSTLVCLLEVNLMVSRPVKQLRHDLQIALKQANSVVRLHRALRELWDAGNVPQDQETLSLTVCLREVAAELLPAAALAKVRVSLAPSSECRVRFQGSRLRQALVHLLEFSLDSCAAGAAMTITADEKGQTARVTVAVSAVAPETGAESSAGEPPQQADGKGRELKRRLRLAMARRTFESANGSLQVKHSGEQLWLEVSLPVISLSE